MNLNAGYQFVTYYNCDCEWNSKYCDENHRVTVKIPKSVLDQYK